MYAASQLLCFTYIISKYFATEAQKRLRNISSNSFFSVFSVPPWQKRFTPKEDLATAYIADQYLQSDFSYRRNDGQIMHKTRAD